MPRIFGSAKRERYLIAGFATLCLGDAAYKCSKLLTHTPPTDHILPQQLAVPRYILLHTITDTAIWLAAAFVCFTIFKLTWKLRQRIHFGITGYLLLMLLAAFGLLQFLDIGEAQHTNNIISMHLDTISLAVEGVIIVATLMLVPFLRRIVEFGLNAQSEHQKLLAAAKASSNALSSRTQQLARELRHATERGEMEINYQPQVDCKTRDIIRVEALLRWNHPELGLISPAEFIPIAEESGIIVSIGEWVLRQSCMQIAALQQQLDRRLALAVNLSSGQFQHKDLTAVVSDALRASGLSAEDLELELTESTLMNDSIKTRTQLNNIRELNVRLAIDDFGTGFSSFQYILDYHVDCLKIDRSFITKCPSDNKATAVVRSIIAMAHDLGILVVAEGVETQDQFNFLLSYNCDICQGFLFDKPMDLESLETRLQQTGSRAAPWRKKESPPISTHQNYKPTFKAK